MQVHPYISTGMANSKFGIRNAHLDWFLEAIKADSNMNLAGVHCHLGSTIKEVSIFRDAAAIMCGFIRQINAEGFQLQYLNFGGGLGIDYSHSGEQYPSPRCARSSSKLSFPARLAVAACELARAQAGCLCTAHRDRSMCACECPADLLAELSLSHALVFSWSVCQVVAHVLWRLKFDTTMQTSLAQKRWINGCVAT